MIILKFNMQRDFSKTGLPEIVWCPEFHSEGCLEKNNSEICPLCQNSWIMPIPLSEIL